MMLVALNRLVQLQNYNNDSLFYIKNSYSHLKFLQIKILFCIHLACFYIEQLSLLIFETAQIQRNYYPLLHQY